MRVAGFAIPRSVPSGEGLRRGSPGEHALDAAVVVPRIGSRQGKHCGELDSSPTSPETPPRLPGVVIAGGQSLVRAARRSVLSRAGLQVVADVEDASRASKAAELYGAGLVLVDSEIPGGCVLAVRRIVARAPASAVLIVAPELDHESLLATVRAGAHGFIAETHGAGSLVRAVEIALAGESVIPRAGVTALIHELRGGPREQTSVDGVPLQLTRREADVITRLREGMTPKQIAYELDLSAVTVRRHLSSVARKARQARPVSVALDPMS